MVTGKIGRRAHSAKTESINMRRRISGVMLAMVAIVSVSGCASTKKSFTGYPDHSSSTTSSTEFSYQSDPYDDDATYGQTYNLQDYFTEAAVTNDLPEDVVSDARIGMAEVEISFTEARANEIDRDARVRERTAQIANDRTRAASDEEITLAEVDELQTHQDAQQVQIAAQLIARERQVTANIQRNVQLVEALAKEQRTKQQDIASKAGLAFEEERAQIEQLRVIRVATESEGWAAIEQMHETARATRERAEAAVMALRQQARSAAETMTARMADLSTQLATVPRQTQAKVAKLKAQGNATQDEARARSSELQAHGDAMERQSAEQEYNLLVSKAKTVRQQKQSDTTRAGAEASADYERSVSEVERLRADANVMLQSSQTEATMQMGELRAWLNRNKVTINLLRAGADRMEKVARAEFVKALARATAVAVHETSDHQVVVSEAQMRNAMANAEAKAAKIRDLIFTELARRTREGLVGFPGKTSASNQGMEVYDIPAVAKVAKIAPHVDPGAVAKFQGSLAHVLHEHTKADAQFSALEAAFFERKTNIEAVRDQKTAVGNEQLAAADGLQLRAVAQLAERNAKITSKLANARSDFERSMVEADAFRRNVLAQVSELRAEAKAIQDAGYVKAAALQKEAQVVARNGQHELDSLQVSLRAAEEEGEAKVSRLTAEADSVEQSQFALADQIDSQIALAETELGAEVANLDRTVETRSAIAEADYREALASAEAIGKQTEMQIKRLEADNELEKAMALAEIERLHDIHFVNTIKNDAEIARRLADAYADRVITDAESDVQQAAVQTFAAMTTASVEAQRRIAAAKSNDVHSMFRTRIVEFDTQKVKRRAEALVKASRERANAETILAQAKAARFDSNKRLARLVRHQETLQRAAVKDWDSRLFNNPTNGFKEADED